MRNLLKAALFGLMLFGGNSLFADDVHNPSFYVSPDGNNAWTGKLSKPNADKTDGPFATITGARDAVRKLKAQGPLSKPIIIVLAKGTYRLDEPVVFTAEDSGLKEAPIYYTGLPGNVPVLSGGVPITGWQKSEGNLWTTTVPGVKEGKWYFHSLWVSGKRCTRARSPNEDWYFAAGPVEAVNNGDPQFENHDMAVKKGFKFKDEDIKKWSNLDDALVVVYHAWTASLHYIDSLDEQNKIVRFTNSSFFPMGFWKELRYHVENVREALDAPGEWYLDRKTGVLTYYPRPDEDMATAEVIAPKLDSLVKIEGESAEGKKVEFLNFEFVSFQHTDWHMDRGQPQDAQSGEFLKDATLLLRHARKCLINRCEFAHTGGYAIWLERGERDAIAQCHLHDLGAGGVRIGESNLPKEPSEQTERINVYNCFIHDGGKVIQEGCGVFIQQSSNNIVTHNEICDLFYTGVSVGWSWGYAPSTAHDNKIEYNHIHHLGWGKLSDMGGIYTLGISPGTTLKNNLIHDVLAFTYGGWGLYTDEGSSGITLENNIVYRVKDGCFHQHYGKDNVLRNNILAYSFTDGQIRRSRPEEHQSFTFERNIVYFDRANLVLGDWSKGTFPFDYNCYFDASGRPIVFPGGLNFEQWQAKGQDKHSIIADPLFVDPQHGNFTLKLDSPALKLDFKPIDVNEIGLTGPAEWRELPKKIERPVMKFPGE